VGRHGVGLGAGAVAPMQRCVVSKEKRLRCRDGKDHADVDRPWISKAPGTSTIPKGAGWKTSMVSRVSVMSMVSRVSMMSEKNPNEMVALEPCRYENDRRESGAKALRNEVQKGSSKIEDDGKARRDITPGAIL